MASIRNCLLLPALTRVAYTGTITNGSGEFTIEYGSYPMSNGHATEGEVTRLLARLRDGNQEAASELIPLVYAELRRLAGSYLRREREGHTLQATALVNEAYLRLIAQSEQNFQSRAHFFGVAANAMRHILVDYARSRQTAKRGGGANLLSLNEAVVFADSHSDQVVALHEALDRLAILNERQARIVELRFFGGLTNDEIAELLGITARTVNRDWSVAQAWLRKETSG